MGVYPGNGQGNNVNDVEVKLVEFSHHQAMGCAEGKRLHCCEGEGHAGGWGHPVAQSGVLLGHSMKQADFLLYMFCRIYSSDMSTVTKTGRGLMIFNLLLSSSRVASPPGCGRWQPCYDHEAVRVWYLGSKSWLLTPVFIQAGEQIVMANEVCS